MNPASIPQHVFISYSRANNDFVQKFSDDLLKEGINVWTDYQGLTPGTPDWESTIRDAINSSFAVLLIASPDSRQSVHVKGEINVAQARDIPVYPIWATEDKWIDCIPLSMSNTQYIDCRPSSYSNGLVTVIDRLSSVIENVIPKHYLLEPLTKLINSDGYERHERVPIPSGYVCVDLPSDDEYQTRAGIVIKVSAYSSFISLLDDLYTNYLHERFNPFTYGREWILVKRVGHGWLFAVPFSWLKFSDKNQYSFDRKWAVDKSPKDIGLFPGTFWMITSVPIEGARGIAINDKRLLWAMLNNPKAAGHFRRLGYVEETTIDTVRTDEYKYAAVAVWGSFGFHTAENSVVRQTTIPLDLDEEEMEYWTHGMSELDLSRYL